MAGSEQRREKPTDQSQRQIRNRNFAMLAALGGLAALFYVVTIVKMGGGG